MKNDSVSSYSRIFQQVMSNDYIKKSLVDKHREYFESYKVDSKKVHFSYSEDSSFIRVTASNPQRDFVHYDAPLNPSKAGSPHISFPHVQDTILFEVLTPMWKVSIKTYNIPLKKFVKWLQDRWSSRHLINMDFPDFTEMQQSIKNGLCALMVEAANEDRRNTIRQSALERVMRFFYENDHIVKHLDIEDVRSLAELEQMRRIHH